MAGVKGRSGGARPNSGGKRAGAGRKPDPNSKAAKERANAPPKEPQYIEDCDMLTMLKNVALGRTDASALQVRAAIAAVQYTHTKKGDGGKKDEVADKAAAVAGGGKYGTRTGPRLVASK